MAKATKREAIQTLIDQLEGGDFDRLIAVFDGPEECKVVHFGIQVEWIPQLLEELAAYLREQGDEYV